MAAHPPQVVVDHRALDAVAHSGIDAVQSVGAMAFPVPPILNAMASDQPTPQRLAAIREQMSLLSDYL